MKNQYFGDNRDLFKYDLIQYIMDRDLVSSFTFIPMLTDVALTNREYATAGTNNKPLVDFLNRCVKERKISKLYGFFPRDKIRIFKEDEEFSQQGRRKYFDEIDKAFLSKSIILVDPDIGLEPLRGPKRTHIRYSNVKDLYDRMHRSSILMIFQFIPRVKREKYFAEICLKLKEKVGNLPINYISDYPVVFFFLTKDKSIEESLAKTITDYGKSYNLDFDRVI